MYDDMEGYTTLLVVDSIMNLVMFVIADPMHT